MESGNQERGISCKGKLETGEMEGRRFVGKSDQKRGVNETEGNKSDKVNITSLYSRVRCVIS